MKTKTKKEQPMTTITQDVDRLDDAVELTNVKPGEYKLRYLGKNAGVDKNGNDYFLARLEIADDPYTKDLTYFIGLPGQYDDAKQMNQKKVKIQDFCLAFGQQPPSTIIEFKALMESGDLVGMEAWAALTEKDNEEYGMQNEVKRFIKPV
jgi:hypothetical protein